VSGGISIRQATVADIPELVRLRRVMFEAMGFDDPAQLDAADISAESYFSLAIPADEFLGWLAVTDSGQVVATGGVVIDQHPPGPLNLSGKCGYIMNLVTLPAYQRRGIARRIMQVMLAWLKDRGVQRVTLHTSDFGKSLYQELGFVESNEMRLEGGQ
jgi:GNAT superfamily N-acetyltransferase